jgi:hypothetical protein
MTVAKYSSSVRSPTEVAKPGAQVKVNGHHFIISVPTKVLRIGGIELSGVSSDSPLFKAMEGLHAGDEFEWNNQTLVLKEIC